MIFFITEDISTVNPMFLSPQMYTPTTRFTDDGDFSFAHFRFSKCHDLHCLFHGGNIQILISISCIGFYYHFTFQILAHLC